MRVRRAIIALAAAAVAVSVLSACQSKVGAAAYVNGVRISETTVAKYVEPNAPAPASGNDSAKTFVTGELVKKEIFVRLVAAIGSEPSDEALSKYHDDALSQAFQTQLAGATADQTLRQYLEKEGVKASFDPVIVHNLELSDALSTFASNASAAITSKLQKAQDDLDIVVNPRYGTWDKSQLELGTAALPSWLKNE